jgi:molybdate transport system substrate-binding protein
MAFPSIPLRLKKTLLDVWCLFVTLLVLAGCPGGPSAQTPSPLTVFCAAGLRKPLESIAAAFSSESGVAVQFQFGGSGTLFSQIRLSRTGDLFIAADEATMAAAQNAGLTREVLPFALQVPVIAVRAGNPRGIASFEDLFHPSVRLALANPEAASIGKTIRTAAGSRWEALRTNATVMKPTVTEIASDLSLGTVDAAVIWEPLIAQFHGLEAVHVPELTDRAEPATAAILASSSHPELALRFARFLADARKGGAILARAGYPQAPGRTDPTPSR